MRWASAARSAQADTTVLVVVGTTTIGTIRKTTATAPPYRESRRSSPSTSSCKNVGGNSPTNNPQQPTIKANWPLLVKLSMEDIHHKQAEQPTTPTSSHQCLKTRR